jgi:tyrosyl-tRNA synthetase
MFGKLMSISDELMARYYPLLLRRELREGTNPFEAKKQLAFDIVQTYHSPAVAQQNLNEWNIRFSKRDLEHADLPEFSLAGLEKRDIVTVVCSCYRETFGIRKPRTKAWQLVEDGSVKLDGTEIRDPKTTVSLKSGQILRLDKKHAVRIR